MVKMYIVPEINPVTIAGAGISIVPLLKAMPLSSSKEYHLNPQDGPAWSRPIGATQTASSFKGEA